MSGPDDGVERAATEESERARRGRADPEPSLGARLARIGALGWMIVVPMLAGVASGRWIDSAFGTGVTFAGALTMLGAALGMWLAWRWMHDS